MIFDDNVQIHPEIEQNPKKEEIKKLLKSIEDAGYVVGYIVVTQNRYRLYGQQFFVGIVRGLGFALGGTILLTLVITCLLKFLDLLTFIDIPLITDLLKQIIELLKGMK